MTDPTITAHDRYLTLNYPRYPITITHASGSTLTDSTGKTYTDLFAGFGAGILGHCHPDLVAAANDQMNKVWHVGNLLHTEPQTRLAQHIAQKGFNGRSYFCHSGSDANEAAFKLARLHGQNKRHKIIATNQSFHGRGFAAMMATGQDKVRSGFAPYLPGFEHVPYNDLDAVKHKIDPETIAIIVEPIQGEGGMNVPDPAYLPGLRDLCDRHDLLLICDEVWTGCGRTGKWFAYQHSNIEPDILTLGKAIGCGLPVGVMCANERAAKYFDFNHYGGVPHATTLGGAPVPTAVSAAMFDIIERDNLLARAESLGDEITERWNSLAQSTPAVTRVRGKGLFLAVELNPKNACFDNAFDVVAKALDQGLVINACQQNILRIAPPLNIPTDQLNPALTLLEKLITDDT